MLSENSFQTVLHSTSELIPNKMLNVMTELITNVTTEFISQNV